MRVRNMFLAAVVIACMFAVSACKHVLIPKSGDSTVRVYQDEEIYGDVMDVQKKLNDKKFADQSAQWTLKHLLWLATTEMRAVDGGTRVKIISSDDKGSVVEVLEGKYIGYKGFVPKENLR